MEHYKKEILPWIGKTAKTLANNHTSKLKENGFNLTNDQWVLLKILSHHNGESQNKIALFTERDKTSMTRLVNTMEKKDYIKRVSSKEDKRIKLLFLTTKGEKILLETEQIRSLLVSEAQKGLSETEINTVIEVMRKIQKNINAVGCNEHDLNK